MIGMTGNASREGYTLVELLIVLAIMGFVGSVVVGTIAKQGRGSLRASASAIVSELRSARAQAQLDHKTLTVSVSKAGQLTITDGGNDRALDVQSMEVRLGGPMGTRAKTYALTFSPEGISNGGLLTVSDGEAEIRIAIARVTGNVSIEQ